MATFSLTANDEMIERSLSGFAEAWEYATAHALDASKKALSRIKSVCLLSADRNLVLDCSLEKNSYGERGE